MASRPIFVPRWEGSRLVEEVAIEFSWHPGFSPTQKKKNIRALHEAARDKGFERILEVSTKSDEKLASRLSAFNLKVAVPDGRYVPLESAYQGSKKFRDGGPFVELWNLPARDAKQNEKLKSSGPLIGFQFGSEEWGLEPKTAFYDWLYMYSLKDHASFLQKLLEYDGFTDIEFNPEKSLNCQVRKCAILASLLRKNLFPNIVCDKELFIGIIRPDSFAQPHSHDIKQGSLF